MIRLYTGLPGHGKTLTVMGLLLKWIKIKYKDEKKGIKPDKNYNPNYHRKIYVAGIDHLKIDLMPELDIEFIQYSDFPSWKTKYHDCIIIVDEAQEIMPQRPKGTAPPFITDLSTHRHNGLDIYFITQNPSLLDIWARKLVDEHIHVKRLFSTNWQVLFKWSEGAKDINDPKQKKYAVKAISRINKKLFKYYKSASTHTIKSNVPIGVIIGFFTIFLFPTVVYYAYQFIVNYNRDPSSTSTTIDAQPDTSIKITSKNKKPQTKRINNSNTNKYSNDSYITLNEFYPIKLCQITGSLKYQNKTITFMTIHFLDGTAESDTIDNFQQTGFDIRQRGNKYYCPHVLTLSGYIPQRKSAKQPKQTNQPIRLDINPLNQFKSTTPVQLSPST